MSQHRYISQELLQDPSLRCRSYSILIIRFCGPAQAKRKFWAPETRFVWPCAGKTVRPRSAGAFRAGETQILSSGDAFCVALRRENNCRDAFFVALRRRNANFELPRCIFCGPAQAKRKFHLRRRVLGPHHVDSRGVTTEWPKIATALQRDAKKKSEPRFRAGETQILTSGVPFSVALRSKKRGGQKKAPRSKRLYPYRKNPSVRHTVWGNTSNDQTSVASERLRRGLRPEPSPSSWVANVVLRS